MDFQQFFRACNPVYTIDMSKSGDRQYYIDFSPARGRIVRRIERTITQLLPDQPTCQLFSGHIGCGKSTELLHLKANLEKQEFYVVYFESTKDLDLLDVDITDILLAIARQVTKSLEAQNIYLQPQGFKEFLLKAFDFLQTPIELKELEFSLPMGIAKIATATKDAPRLRHKLRQYLEPQTTYLLKMINQEVLAPATKLLQEKGYRGIVVIVDNLDRVTAREMPFNRLQTEYIFIDRGDQLRQLNCHLVYTIPLALLFSNDAQQMINRLGGMRPNILPMVPVRCRNGQVYEKGLQLMRQMLLIRAFPQLDPDERLNNIHQIFDSLDTLDRLCDISGGHPRHFLSFFQSCLQEDDLPISRNVLEGVIREQRDTLEARVDDHEWQLILKVIQQQSLNGEKECQALLSSMFIFEYCDESGRWFGVNPALSESLKFKKMMKDSKIP